jgi:hypothetical protein
LHESQNACQKEKSAETALHDLVSRVKGALEQNIFAMGSFLDIECAFDNTSFLAMNKCCGEHGVNPTSTRWIDALLGQRIVTAIIRGENITMKVRKGCYFICTCPSLAQKRQKVFGKPILDKAKILE